MMKKSQYVFLTTGLLLLLFSQLYAQNAQPDYKNSSLPISVRVKDLVSRMTLKEKVRQMDMYSGQNSGQKQLSSNKGLTIQQFEKIIGDEGIGAIHDYYPQSAKLTNELQQYVTKHTRLGIPILFIEEGLHDYGGKGSTVFPQSIGLSSTWDPPLVKKVGHAIASEARAHGVDMLLCPVLGIAREPRWGRVEETYGEDPYLDSEMGLAMVEGLQGKTLSSNSSVIAEPKHFAAHSIPEGGLNTSPALIGKRELESDFLPVFKKAFVQGGAMGVMSAYSETDGIPNTANHWLLTTMLRQRWGFKGFVLSDLGALHMLQSTHKVAATEEDAIREAVKAGLNMQFYDYSHQSYQDDLIDLVHTGQLSMHTINERVCDILRVKFMLGLFDHPYINTDLVSKVFHSQNHQQLALKAARESITLLKNEHNLLPLKKNLRRIVVFGPSANVPRLGEYTQPDPVKISVLQEIKKEVGSRTKIYYAKGTSIMAQDVNLKSSSSKRLLQQIKRANVAIYVGGDNNQMDGEGHDVASLQLPEGQKQLLKAAHATGTPIVAVLENGRPYAINWIKQHIPAILECWYPGERGSEAIANVLFGDYNPGGKLPITFPKSVGQIPVYYDYKPSARPKNYVNLDSKPLFPFGYGLSYTTFSFSDLKVQPKKSGPEATYTVTADVKNTGNRAGDEVAQLYIDDEVSSVTTPVEALKGFHRVHLQPGQTKTVTFKLTPQKLHLLNRDFHWVVEPGVFKVMVGGNSQDVISSTFKVTPISQ